MPELTCEQLVALCEQALIASGASAAQALALAQATVEAEARGMAPVGVSHLLDYLDGFRQGRIRATEPEVEQPTSVITSVDCRGGLAQHGFQSALPQLLAAASTHGIGVLAMRECFTAGELGYFVRHLNQHGLLAVACANSPALMTVAGANGPLLGSNPLAFGIPLDDEGHAVVFDQASAATAWVRVRDAALQGNPIPDSWAVDADGQPTTSAQAGLDGALLPFGGYKGGNIALLVEVLATLGGGLFSSQAPAFNNGSLSPAIGVVVVAVNVFALNPDYPRRLAEQLDIWARDFGAKPEVWHPPAAATTCSISADLHQSLNSYLD